MELAVAATAVAMAAAEACWDEGRDQTSCVHHWEAGRVQEGIPLGEGAAAVAVEVSVAMAAEHLEGAGLQIRQ